MRRVFILIFAAVIALTLFGLSFIEKVDDGYIVSFEHRVVDPVGEFKLAVTRNTRDCTHVLKYPANSAIVESLKTFIDGETAAEKSIPRVAWISGDWVLIETDFVNLEPAIFLLRSVRQSQYAVAATYGGTATPFNTVQSIHEYFHKVTSDAPAQLIDCYEPAGVPFNQTSE